jgi:glycosyltransferase involved in cell wall biosynthesis
MASTNSREIGIVIPTRNEEGNLADVLSELNKIGYENILVIDGNSEDRTREIAKEYGAKVVFQDGNGKGSAVRQVFNNGYVDADAVLLMDADGSMRPSEIPAFLVALNSGADIVKGSRFLKGGYTYDMNLLRRFGNFIFLSLVNLFWSTRYTDLCYGFGVFKKDAVKEIAPVLKSANFEIETEIFIKAKKMGLKIVEIPSIESRRKHGKSNLKAFRDGFRILKTIIQEFIHANDAYC